MFGEILKRLRSISKKMDIEELKKKHRSMRYLLWIGGLAKNYYIVPVFLVILLLFYFVAVGGDSNRSLNVVPYNEFISKIDEGKIKEVSIGDTSFDRVLIFEEVGENDAQGESYRTVYLSDDDLRAIVDKGVLIKEDFHVAKDSDLAYIFINAVTYTALIVMLKFMFGGMNSKEDDHNNILHKKEKITFDDIKGIEESKAEFKEIIDIFAHPEEYEKMNIKVPKGILLVGDPGTGKTLLAKAAAYESNAMFIATSGSSFVQMFVGLGALRVRQLFSKARKHKPTIIFIDEIDSLCSSREGTSGSSEHNSTVNALLAELDGFKGNERILIIGATNNPDGLDPAVTRPGRFDRHIHVGSPSVGGRKELFDLYLNKLPTDDSVDSERLARSTIGLTGAQIAYITNESGIIARRESRNIITMDDIEKARDRLLLGYENISREVMEDEKRNTAFHEASHAVAGYRKCKDKYVDKISIVPRGASGGHTLFLEKLDRQYRTKSDLRNEIIVLLAGRAGESAFFGEDNVTTGAQNDLERATQLAELYVTQMGFSEGFGIAVKAKEIQHLNESYQSKSLKYVDDLLNSLALETKLFVEENKLLIQALADELIDKETMNKKEIAQFFDTMDIEDDKNEVA